MAMFSDAFRSRFRCEEHNFLTIRYSSGYMFSSDIGIRQMNDDKGAKGELVVARELVWLEYDRENGMLVSRTPGAHGKMQRVFSASVSDLDRQTQQEVGELGGVLGVASGHPTWSFPIEGPGDDCGTLLNINTMISLYRACIYHRNNGVLEGFSQIADVGRKARAATESTGEYLARVGKAIVGKGHDETGKGRKELLETEAGKGRYGPCQKLPLKFLSAMKAYFKKMNLSVKPLLGGRPSKAGRKSRGKKGKMPKMPRGAKIGARVGTHWVVYRKKLTPADRRAGRKKGRKALRPLKGASGGQFRFVGRVTPGRIAQEHARVIIGTYTPDWHEKMRKNRAQANWHKAGYAAANGLIFQRNLEEQNKKRELEEKRRARADFLRQNPGLSAAREQGEPDWNPFRSLRF